MDANGKPFVVALGASAGGLAALTRFFASMPADSGLTFVVVVHPAPEYQSQFAEQLQSHTRMPVQQVAQVTPLQRNHVYVIPPGRNLSAIDTHLRLSDLAKNRRARVPINHLFRSLANSHNDHAIGIILSGTGSDGTLGLKQIKQRGGLTIAQDPNDAEYEGMPQSAVATGLIDLVVPLNAIPGHLLHFVATRLRQLTDTLHNLMAATDIATLLIDRQLRIVHFTPKVAQIFNVRSSDVLRPLTELTHRLDYAQLCNDAKQALRDLTPIEREVFDQQGRYYLAQLRPYRSSDDRIEGVVLTFVDITRRKRSEDALRATEEQFRALVEASAQIIWTTDPSGNAVDDSPGWEALTGQRLEQRQGFGWIEAVHPGDRELVAGNWRQCLASGRQFNAEFRLHHADSGLYRWVVARAVPLHEPDGARRGWVGMIIDITERKQAEATRIHFQRLFESAPGLYLVLEPERYTIVTASDAYLEAAGAERAAITGRPLFEAFPNDPDDPLADGVQNLEASLARVKSQRRTDVLALQRYPVPRANGGFEERFWSALNVPVYGLDGELAYIIHRVEDVTPFIRLMREQDREAEGHELLESRAEHMQADIALRAAELQQLNEALQSLNESLERRVHEGTEQVRDLASSLATAEQDERARVGRILHDNLQQLLYGIQLKLALLAEEAATAGQHHLKEYADDAQHWIGDAVNTTRQLSIDLSPPLLSEDKLGDALEWLQSQMLELHQLHVELEVDDAIRLPDSGLRVLLLQSVRELLFNVVKHADTDRAVVSATEIADGEARQLAIQVADRGHGFASSRLDHALQSSSFGLARMRGRLELFGGRLEIDSQPGAGARVTIYLPQGEATADPATGRAS